MTDANESLADHRIRTMQLIAGAIIGGAASFLVVAIVLRTLGNMPPPAPAWVTTIALVFAVGIAIAHGILPDVALRAGKRPTGEADEWYAVYQTRLILRLALLESAAFFLLIAYLIEGAPVSLVAAALCIAGMALGFPTRTGISAWVERQRQATLSN